MKTLWPTTLALLCSLGSAHAGMGETTLNGLAGDGKVTVYYPSAAADQPVRRGPFTLSLAPEAPPLRGNGRLVVVSHGSGGTAWVHTDLAHALVEAGFVVALPQHRGDNAWDDGTPGPESWKRRPAEVSRAIDAVAQDTRFAPLLALDRVGGFGQSAGGHTMLSLAGGVWSSAGFLRHCEAHLAQDFNACVGTATQLTGGWWDGFKLWLARTVLRHTLDDDTPQPHHDPRIAAVVAGVPAAADFDLSSLQHPRIPVGLITAGQDIWLTPRWHGEAVAAACVPCVRLAHLPEAGHSVLLSPLPPLERLDRTRAMLLADPPGFDRPAGVAQVNQSIVQFMRQHLPPTVPASPATTALEFQANTQPTP